MRKFIRLIVLLFCFSALSKVGFSAITIGETQTNATCYGGADGAINLTPGGGVAPYTYLWNDGNTNQNRTNLGAGNYAVTVTDNVGATAALAMVITEGQRFIVGVNATGENCGGQNIGTITLNVSGAAPGYTYLWSDGATTQNRTGLTAAVYYVTITDSKLCKTVDSDNVTQPPGIGITGNVSLATCGANNGAIALTIQYGTPAYTYLWNDGSVLQNRTGMAIGAYMVTVTDANGCSGSATEVVGSLPGSMTINTASTQPVCNGDNNATINITGIIGSTGPYTYAWSTGATTSNLTGLAAGPYTVTVTSGTGCTSSNTVNIAQPAPINIQLTVIPLTCFGANNGAINTNVTGGVSPYSYNWSGGMHVRNVISLQSTNYTVTVTDVAGCTATSSAFVTQPLQLAAIATPSPLACAGGPTGSVITTVTGGTPAYTYWWGAGITSPDRINVNSGNYSVTVTDGNGCTAVAGANVPAYTPLSLSTTQVNNVCYHGNTGSIDLTVNNGLNPYSFAWSTGTGAQNISALADGTYSVTVTDGHVCTATISATIAGPLFATVINATTVDASCNGAGNGSININLSNGNPPFTYDWGGGVTSQNRTNLAAGNYIVTATDNSGCSVTSAFNINQPSPILIAPAVSNVSCFGGNNGAIVLGVSGSFAPYTYHWNDGATAQNRTNIAVGNYVITVTDNHSCTASASMFVTQPTQINVTPTVVNLTCNGINTGSINIAVSGGTGGYTYNWGGGITTQNRTNLSAGSYVVTVTDNSNCSVSSSNTLTQPAANVITLVVTNVVCNGAANGAIIANANGGVSPYTFDWGGGVTTQNRSNLAAGSYTVTVTDFSGCTATNTATISQPAALVLNATTTNVSCNGGNNGAINITVAGGTAPYGFNWGGGINTQNRSNLPAGNYAVTVTDNAGCTATSASVITQPAQLSVVATKTDVTCNGTNTGAINIAVAGGITPYSFNWGGGITVQNRPNLNAGVYTVTVTDNGGCTAVNTNTILQPTPLVISGAAANVTCNGASNGAVNITVTGSVAPYTYNWGAGVITQNQANIVSGAYVVTVSDLNSCTATASFIVTQPAAITPILTPLNVACFGQSTGGVNLAVSGGTGGYSYLWSNGGVSQNIRLITAGAYSVTVTDANFCTASALATITEPTQLNVTVNSVQNTSCFNSNNGSVTIAASGGTGAYTYLWSNNSVVQNIVNATAGNYLVTVTDANLCTVTASATVTQPAAILVNSTATNVSCFNGSDGQITSAASGGLAPYGFNWSNLATTASITGLVAASYDLTVTDASNCSVSAVVNVLQPAALVVTPVPVNVSCNGSNNGSIALNVTGGTGTYNYLWSNGATVQQVVNLAPNNYSVTVTDANACTATQSVNITAPVATTLSETHTDFACVNHAGTINLTPGGAAPFSFDWGGGITLQNRSNLAAGNYTVTLTDANSCTAASSIAIAALPPVSPTLNSIGVTCFAGNDGAVNLSVTGGTQPFIYRWNNNATSPNISNLVAGQYGIVVTDANNCSASASATVVQPAQLQIVQNVTAAHCNGYSDGAIDLTVNGGTPAYSYNWNTGSNSPNITGLAVGAYQVTVTDAHLCTAIMGNITIAQPAQIVVLSTVLPIGCAGQADGGIELSVSGGTSPYNYLWTTGGVSKDVWGLATGNYSVTVTDNNGCTSTQTYNVGSAPPIDLTATIQNASCAGVMNGKIELSVNGGTPGYSYSWNIGSPLDLGHLAEGLYKVTLTDALGCSAQYSFNVGNDYQLTLQAGPATTIKPGQFATITATASVDHGNVYNWEPSASLSCSSCLVATATPRETTNYTIYAVDTNGCKASAEVTVAVNSTFNVYVPNAFTPNGDGNNDEFQIFGDLSTMNYVQLSVFNRWGELVFETNDANFRWDGNYKGQVAPQGVYIYVMQAVFSDGSKRDLKGSVTLMR